MNREAYVIGIANIATAALGFFLLALDRSAYAFALGCAIASVVSTTVAGFFVFRRSSFSWRHVRSDIAIPMLKSAFPIAIAGLPSVFLFSIDIVLLGMWWTAKDVGVYAAILKTVGILSVMVSLLATSTFPLFSRLAAHNRKQLGYLLERMFRILGVIAFPLIAGGIVVAPQLLTLLFGSDYISGIGPFTLLLFSILATYPLTILMNVVFACDVQRRTMYMPFVAAGISVALNLLLIPPFGVWGAVIAMVISNFVYTTLLFRVVNTLVPFTFASFLVVPMIASVVMGLGAAILSMIHIHVIIVIFLSVAVYFAMLFLFRDATLQETLKLIRNQ